MIYVLALAKEFEKRYGKKARVFRAPGRVNLIGEHTDYNDGFVLPMAIDRGAYVAVAARPDAVLRVHSVNLDESVEFDLDNLGGGQSRRWGDYVEGVASALIESRVRLCGADVLVESDVSIGGGLSSSAALEISIGLALTSIAGCCIDSRTLAFAGQTAEHKHVGIHCGIMDQFVAVNAVKGHAILLDCRSLDSKLIALPLKNHSFVICDSAIRHELASSEYNRRRKDCEKGVELLQKSLPNIGALRDVSPSEFEAVQAELPRIVRARCMHVIKENSRTLEAAEFLDQGDLVGMGRLMTESHRSLRDDFEVSCPELDLLVESALRQPGVLGARMTGGGFGGCTVNLVEKSGIPLFSKKVSKEYQAATGRTPDITVAEAGQGAEEIVLK